ncbi:MAG: hypothetical protein JO036_07460 [Candidatus Eremiobacteraeota bacterium]|nr:hypothetical protein [Candidatus Eremiobacteraeota bacterium]
MTVNQFTEFVANAAPFISAALAIGAAGYAEAAFRLSISAQPPERWRGEDVFHTDFDQKEEVNDRSVRNVFGVRAGAVQSLSTYFAAAAAVEAAAASQHGIVTILAASFGVAFAAVLGIRRWRIAKASEAYTKAWFVRLNWATDRKWVYSGDPAVEDAKFAEEHPAEANILRRRTPDRKDDDV